MIPGGGASGKPTQHVRNTWLATNSRSPGAHRNGLEPVGYLPVAGANVKEPPSSGGCRVITARGILGVMVGRAQNASGELRPPHESVTSARMRNEQTASLEPWRQF
jgi:hypothetical protein